MAPQREIPDSSSGPVLIRPLHERDLERADRIFRVAFGTFLALPNPETFSDDADCVRTRWLADPASALAAEVNGEIVGSNFITRWGSVGFFGPLTVHPSLWERGIAKKLLAPTLAILDGWQLSHVGLHTFSDSAKHIALYQQFGFWPRFLTMIMSKAAVQGDSRQLLRFSELRADEKALILKECFRVTDSVYPGLDVEREIRAVDSQRLGDTILLMDHSQLAGFAVCHCGAGSEAGSGNCYLKFAVIDARRTAEERFQELLKSCEQFAVTQGVARLTAGVNTSRLEAYRSLLAQGFRSEIRGVIMKRGNDNGYNHEGVYLIDDWR
ncbi:MAG: GNAT family N-acetyltransferase [Candidatus Korobacteraceae bacterium]|jgi:GNAT superfamily N-acetyltransferase